MKFSMCTAVYGMHDLQDTIHRAAQIGFDAVELTAAKHLPIEREELRSLLRRQGCLSGDELLEVGIELCGVELRPLLLLCRHAECQDREQKGYQCFLHRLSLV